MSRIRFSLVALAMLAVAAPAAPAAGLAAPAVYAVSSAVTVRASHDVAVPAEAKSASADIVAARNEFESVQVVVEAGGAQVDNVAIGMADAAVGLTGPDGATIPAANISVYREHSYTVAPDKISDGEGATGAWPDPLIPAVDPFYGQQRNAWPVHVPQAQRVVAWIDVLVPKGQAAGQYNGTIRVSTSGATLETIPLRLKVLNFEIPSTASMDSAFLTQDMTLICRAHTGTTNCGNVEKQWALHSLYARAALENRVTLSNIAPLGQNEGPPKDAKLTYFNKYIHPLITGTNPTSPPSSVASKAWSSVRLPGAKLTTQSIYGYASWHCLGTCVTEWENFAAAKGYQDRLWLYACDEPGREETKWAECSKPGRGLTRQTPLRKLVTAHPKRLEDFSSMSYVDLLTTQVRELTGKPHCCNDWFDSYSGLKSYFDKYLVEPTGPTNRQWLYTACDSMGCDHLNSENPAWNSPLYDGWAGYGIDQPSTQARMMGWLVYLFDARGELYYDMTAKLPTAWTNQFWFGGQGDGTFFYPGIAKDGSGEAAGAVIIGGTDDIPIESIRLKRVRDSREDYEYLRKLEMVQDKSEALARAKDLFGSATDSLAASRDKAPWTTPTPVDLEQVRCDLASRITQSRACDFGEAPPPPAPTGTDLEVTATAVKAPAGPNLTFRVTITNNGPDASAGSTLYNRLPSAAMLISHDAVWCSDFAEDTLACSVAGLEAGQSAAVNFVIRPGHEGPLSNWGYVEGADPDPKWGNNDDTSTVGPTFICDKLGTSAADSIVGTDASEVLCGRGGNDLLLGGRGDDLLFGGTGSDTIRYAGSPHAMTVNLNFQRPTADGAWPRHSGQTGHGMDRLSSVERAAGSSYGDILGGRDGHSDRLSGNGGADILRGYRGVDRLYGGTGRDELYGGDGSDTLKGGGGSDLCREASDAHISCER